ncbi:hypothetical protein [Pseudomonas citronellolis]|uniref:hypothetical protein n=1 Tax=Pseudomonas citronellolis TaxID=53408 RepID=UPI0023E3BA23|nr:hypothetical protein [Pseudomonas citronellolis]MDF3936874.1 hypothetical protein [Pseudomonas citronellolis]
MKRSLILLSALMIGATLHGCGGGDDKAKAEKAAAAAVPVDTCSGHPLEKALPPTKTLYGYPFISRECGYNEAKLVYGTPDGSQHLEISLIDTGMPAPVQDANSDQAIAYRGVQDKLRDMTHSSLTLLNKTRETALQNGTADKFGGDDYLPVIDTTRMGDPLGIVAPAKGEPGDSTLTGLIKGRYVLTITSPDKPNGGSTQSMRQLFVPIVEQMKLTALP